MMRFFTTIFLFLLAICCEAKLINVDVGNGGIIFRPSTIIADVGDQVQFLFYNNHSVVQSNFIDPCTPIKNAFYSGFIVADGDGPAKDSFVITVKTKETLWFYCSQGGHCQYGMSGAINAAGGQQALSSYQNAAILAPNNVTPKGGATGGRIGPIISSPLSPAATKSTVDTSTEVSSTTTSTKVSSVSSVPPVSHTTSSKTETTTHSSSVTPSKPSSQSTSSKTSASTPPSSKASRKHSVTKTTALAVLTTLASLKTSSCTWRA